MDDAFLTTADAGRILSTTPENVRSLERKGVLPAERTSSGIRLFRRADVEELAAKRAARANARESANG